MASNDLINTIIAEAGGEGRAGIEAAVWAIAQRAAARGQTMDEVIRSGFDGYTNPGSGAIKAQQNQGLRNEVAQVIQGVQSGTIPNPVPGADHFLSGNVMPSWANSMQPVATIGGHRFYASGQVPRSAYGAPVPPLDVPGANAVATALDVTRPRTAPTPASISPIMAASRAVTSPSGGNGALTSALPNFITRERNRVTPAPVEDRVTARNVATARQDAIQDAARRASLQQTQSYVGQDRSAPRSQFNGDPMMPAAGPVVATIPSRPMPALQSAAVGGPPTTRAVPTTTVRPLASAAKNIADARSEQAAQRVKPSAQIASVPSQPTQAQRLALLATPPAIPDRLSSSPAGLPALYGSMTPQQVSQIGVPSLAPPAVTPMRSRPAPIMAASAPKVAPIPASVAQMNVARNGSWSGNVFTPPQRPISSAFLAQQAAQAPIMAAAQQPLTIRVQGSNTIPVAPRVVIPAGPTAQQRVDFGNWATRNSDDNSTGSQADAAAARSSGDGGRIRRY